jgi:hypothetical protein
MISYQMMAKILFFLTLLAPLFSMATTVSLGAGTSSFTYGRAVPSLNLAVDTDSKWGVEYQSEGVQTTIYSQNAWTVAGYKIVQENQTGILGAAIGIGLGGSYMLRTYRTSLTANTEKSSDTAVGPYFSAKFKVGIFYIGFNTLLGLTSSVQEHIVLNFQEMSHLTVGVSL